MLQGSRGVLTSSVVLEQLRVQDVGYVSTTYRESVGDS